MIGRRCWSGARQQDQVVELVVAVRLAGDGAAVEQRAHGRRGLVHPVQALAEAAAELDPVGLVLRLEPGPADAQDRPPVAQVVERGGQLGGETGIAEGVGADQQAKPHALGDLGPGGQAHPSLEDRLQRVAEDRVQVVPGPEMVVAELVDPARGVLVRRPVGGLVPEQARRAAHRSPIGPFHSVVKASGRVMRPDGPISLPRHDAQVGNRPPRSNRSLRDYT